MGWSLSGPMEFGQDSVDSKNVSSRLNELNLHRDNPFLRHQDKEPFTLLQIQNESKWQKPSTQEPVLRDSQKVLISDNHENSKSSPFARNQEKGKNGLPSWMVPQPGQEKLATKEPTARPVIEQKPKEPNSRPQSQPFEQSASKPAGLKESNRFSLPEAPAPVYRDANVRAGNIQLTKLDSQEAAKIIDAIPELFRKEGMRELSILTADDAKKKQVYVSQDAANFRKEHPGQVVYGSIQEAVNQAPKDSVINVLAGKNGQAYSENIVIGRSDVSITTNQQNPATIERGGFNISSNIHNVKILNFDFRNFTGREAAIRVEGKNIDNIVVGGNYFYSAVGSEAAGFYGTGSAEQEAMKNIYLVANVVGRDRQGNSKPINITEKQLEATPFNGNVSDVVAVGNLYFGTKETPLNLGMDFIGGENVSGNSELNRARNAFVAYNYSKHIGHPQRWASGVAYIDGASRITEVLNMAESSNFCGEIGAERPGAHSRDNTFNGNLCKDIQNYWITVGAPDNNGARVSGSRIQNNIIIGKANNGDSDPKAPQLQYNAGISRQEITSQNYFFNRPLEVSSLPQKIVDLYRYHYGVKK